MIIVGLTGSIGMGKSTTSEMFRQEGIPVHDSDAVVHALYSCGAAPLIEAEFPGTVEDGSVNRQALGKQVIGNKPAMKRLEAIIHPLVAEERDRFLMEAREQGSKLAVLDIPLLFETGGDQYCDFTIVVTAPEKEQRKRVLSRPEMTGEKLEKILASQMPDSEKRMRADFLIDTSLGMDAARLAVQNIITELTGKEVPDA